MIKLASIALMLGAYFGAAPAFAYHAEPTPFGGWGSLCFNAWGHGTKMCNCGSAPANFSVCHSEEVEIGTGSGSPFSVSTTQSATTCSNQSVAPGMCVQWAYRFRCCRSFFGWECSLQGIALTNPAMDPDDCP